MHKAAASAETADRFDAHVPDGRRGRQAEAGRGRRAAGMVLQGRRRERRRHRRAARRRPPSRSMAARSRRSPAIYVIGPDGTPLRLGFALGNEFSDHVTERGNYLWLAHSKLRPASLGPELLTGRAARPTCEGVQPHPARRRGDLGKAVPVGRGQHVPHDRQSRAPPFQIRRCSAGPATCTCTSSAPRRCRSPTASSTQDGDVFEIEARPVHAAAAQPACDAIEPARLRGEGAVKR